MSFDSGMSSIMETASYERFSTASSTFSDEGVYCKQRETQAKRVDSIEEEVEEEETSNTDVESLTPHISKPSTLEEKINLVANEDEDIEEVVAKPTMNETSNVFPSNEKVVEENVEYSSREDCDGKDLCRYSDVEADFGLRTTRQAGPSRSRGKRMNWCHTIVIVASLQILFIGGTVVFVLWKIETMQELLNELKEESSKPPVTPAPRAAPSIHNHEITEKYFEKFPLEYKSNQTRFVPLLHCDVDSQTKTSNNIVCKGNYFSVERTAKYHMYIQLFVYGGVESLKVEDQENIYVDIICSHAHAGSSRNGQVISKSTLRTSDGTRSKVLTTYLSATMYLERGDKIYVKLSAALPEKVRLQKAYSSISAFEL